MTGNSLLPAVFGAATCLPAYFESHSCHVGHQLPGTFSALSNHFCGSDSSAPSVCTQKFRFSFAGGLITPAMWPLAPSTKVLSPASRPVLAYAVFHGTMWSSFEA